MNSETKILEIKTYPDPILSVSCSPVEKITEEILTLIQNMFDTMYNNRGIGLSANQVGISKRIFVMDTSIDKSQKRVFINPEIISYNNVDRFKEGCLSFPNIFAYVKRPTEITISALNEKNEKVILNLNGIEAICFQHELDHLNGITFYDHLSPLQKNLIKKRIANLKK